MQEALAAADGVQTRAARMLGMPLRTFVTKLKQHGLGSAARRPAGQARSPTDEDDAS
jgi:DNA-binding NtrC family response regulator